MANCQRCGQEQADEARFCVSCGAPMGALPPGEQPTQPAYPEQTTPLPPAAPFPAPPAPPAPQSAPPTAPPGAPVAATPFPAPPVGAAGQAPPAGPPGAVPPGAVPPPPGAPAGRSGRRLLPLALVAVGVVAVLVVGGLFLRGLLGGSDGAGSPEDAVQSLADAIDKEDPAAIAAALAPDEVRSLTDVIDLVEAKGEDAGLASKGDTYSGLDVKVQALDLQVQEVGPDVARVTIRRGKASVAVDRRQVGPKTKELTEGASQTSRADVDAKDLADDLGTDPYVMAVKQDGGWYVSLGLTVADHVVRQGDLPAGAFDAYGDDGADAAATPEQAVEQLATAIGNVDVDQAVRNLSQPEWAVAQVYRRAIEGAIEEAQGDGDLDGFELKIASKQLRVEDAEDSGRKVVIARAAGSVSWTDEDDEPVRRTWNYDGRCLVVEGDGDSSEVCVRDDTSYIGRQIGLRSAYVIVVEERGGWAVSPVSTLMSYAQEVLPKVTPELVYDVLGRPDLADPAGEVQLGKPTPVELGSAGYATYDLTLADAGTYYLASEQLEDVELLDGDGEEIFADSYMSAGAVFDLDAGAYHLVGRRSDYDRGRPGTVTMTEVATEELPDGVLEGDELDGSLTAATPVQDYTFTAPSTATYTLELDSSSVGAEVLDVDGAYICDEITTDCALTEGTDYVLRLSSLEGGAEDFTLTLGGSAASIDGEQSVDVDLGTSGGTQSHDISVPDGTVIIAVTTTGGDVDCSSSDGQVFDAIGDEIVEVTGPYEATWDCRFYAGGGTYTIEVREE